MTDREAFIAMLDRAGVKWDTQQSTVGDSRARNPYRNDQGTNDGVERAIVIEAKLGPRNEGYSGFVSIFDFAEDGSLHHVEVWE